MLNRFSHVWLFVIPWTVAHQAPLSMEFSMQEYWSGCHVLLQGIFSTQRLNLCILHLLHWQVNTLPLSHLGSPKIYYQLLFRWSSSVIIYGTDPPPQVSRCPIYYWRRAEKQLQKEWRGWAKAETQLLMCQVVKMKSDAGKTNIA